MVGHPSQVCPFNPSRIFLLPRYFESSILMYCWSLWLWIDCTPKFFSSVSSLAQRSIPKTWLWIEAAPRKWRFYLLWFWWRPVFIFFFFLQSFKIKKILLEEPITWKLFLWCMPLSIFLGLPPVVFKEAESFKARNVTQISLMAVVTSWEGKHRVNAEISIPGSSKWLENYADLSCMHCICVLTKCFQGAIPGNGTDGTKGLECVLITDDYRKWTGIYLDHCIAWAWEWCSHLFFSPIGPS